MANNNEESQKILRQLMEAIRLRRKYTPCGDHTPHYYDQLEMAFPEVRASSSNSKSSSFHLSKVQAKHAHPSESDEEENRSRHIAESNAQNTPSLGARDRSLSRKRKKPNKISTVERNFAEDMFGANSLQSSDDTDGMFGDDDEGKTDWLDPFFREEPADAPEEIEGTTRSMSRSPSTPDHKNTPNDFNSENRKNMRMGLSTIKRLRKEYGDKKLDVKMVNGLVEVYCPENDEELYKRIYENGNPDNSRITTSPGSKKKDSKAPMVVLQTKSGMTFEAPQNTDPITPRKSFGAKNGDDKDNSKIQRRNIFPVPSLDEYYNDMDRLFSIRSDGPVASYTFFRLKMLQAKFELHLMVNHQDEVAQQRDTAHRDFYNVRKVDNHIHHSAAMNAKHLLRFMKKKFKKKQHDVVMADQNSGKAIKLQDIGDKMGFLWSDLTINRLDMWTDRSCMHRFDRFNNLYSPLGQGELRALFLKTDNQMQGRYLAELTRELLDDLEDYKYQHAEWRLSIYGRNMGEWDKLAKWVLGREGYGLSRSNLTELSSHKNKTKVKENADLLIKSDNPLQYHNSDINQNPAQVAGVDRLSSDRGNETPGGYLGSTTADSSSGNLQNVISSGTGEAKGSNSGNNSKSGTKTAVINASDSKSAATPIGRKSMTNVDEYFKNPKALISPNNMWMIQIPRLFEIYKKSGLLQNFEQMLSNIFLPLFEVTLDPDSHPDLHEFLLHVGGFDTVDDESKSQSPVDRNFSSRMRLPHQWDISANPSYKYYSFYIQSNLRVLNRLRALKGLNQFKYRPHAGEAGEVHHLDTAFLLADGINHGINLRKSPALQYLFYMTQIGISVSPCSNNQLFLPYDKNPFYQMFQKGLNVTLSTDDPLMFHQTKEPLLEEYAIAKQVWKLSLVDLCEIAEKSVLQSSYPVETQLQWLGLKKPSDLYRKNSTYHSNVPAVRHKFRLLSLQEELALLRGQQCALVERAYDLLVSPKFKPADPAMMLAGVVGGDMLTNPMSAVMDNSTKSAAAQAYSRANVFEHQPEIVVAGEDSASEEELRPTTPARKILKSHGGNRSPNSTNIYSKFSQASFSLLPSPSGNVPELNLEKSLIRGRPSFENLRQLDDYSARSRDKMNRKLSSSAVDHENSIESASGQLQQLLQKDREYQEREREAYEKRKRKKEREKASSDRIFKDPLNFSNPLWMLAGIVVGVVLTRYLSNRGS